MDTTDTKEKTNFRVLMYLNCYLCSSPQRHVSCDCKHI